MLSLGESHNTCVHICIYLCIHFIVAWVQFLSSKPSDKATLDLPDQHDVASGIMS